MAYLSMLHQLSGELVEDYIRHFKKLKCRCKVVISEIEFVKMATRGMYFELKFEGMEFKDLFKGDLL